MIVWINGSFQVSNIWHACHPIIDTVYSGDANIDFSIPNWIRPCSLPVDGSSSHKMTDERNEQEHEKVLRFEHSEYQRFEITTDVAVTDNVMMYLQQRHLFVIEV